MGERLWNRRRARRVAWSVAHLDKGRKGTDAPQLAQLLFLDGDPALFCLAADLCGAQGMLLSECPWRARCDERRRSIVLGHRKRLCPTSDGCATSGRHPRPLTRPQPRLIGLPGHGAIYRAENSGLHRRSEGHHPTTVVRGLAVGRSAGARPPRRATQPAFRSTTLVARS